MESLSGDRSQPSVFLAVLKVLTIGLISGLLSSLSSKIEFLSQSSELGSFTGIGFRLVGVIDYLGKFPIITNYVLPGFIFGGLTGLLFVIGTKGKRIVRLILWTASSVVAYAIAYGSAMAVAISQGIDDISYVQPLMLAGFLGSLILSIMFSLIFKVKLSLPNYLLVVLTGTILSLTWLSSFLEFTWNFGGRASLWSELNAPFIGGSPIFFGLWQAGVFGVLLFFFDRSRSSKVV